MQRLTSHCVMFPVASVENKKEDVPEPFDALILCTPSEKLKAEGVTVTKFKLSPKGALKVREPIILSAVVYGPETRVKSLPV